MATLDTFLMEDVLNVATSHSLGPMLVWSMDFELRLKKSFTLF